MVKFSITSRIIYIYIYIYQELNGKMFFFFNFNNKKKKKKLILFGFLHSALCIFKFFILKKFDKSFKSSIGIISQIITLQKFFNTFQKSVVTIDTNVLNLFMVRYDMCACGKKKNLL